MFNVKMKIFKRPYSTQEEAKTSDPIYLHLNFFFPLLFIYVPLSFIYFH